MTLISENRQVVKDARERAINIKIYQNGGRKMKRKIFGILFALVLVLSLSLVTAVPVAAATLTVDTSLANTPPNYHTIQAAVDAAGPGDTIIVAAGTYAEDLVIPAAKSNLELVGATGATIKGVATTLDASFPLAVPNIDILSSGVKIHGFTIEGPDDVSGEYASGLLIGAANVEIYDNDFKVTAGRATWAGPVSTGIVTYRKTAVPTVDISGLNIHDNTFTNHGTGAAGFDAIFVNLDTGTGSATIADNEFTGNVARAISAERSNMVISGNIIVTDLAIYSSSAGGYQGMFIGCFAVASVYPAQSDVSITANIVKGSSSGKGFAQGIRVGHTQQTSLTNITVSQNTVQDCDEGITVRADATGVTVNYNNIENNGVGVQNDTTVDLDAENNWWGANDGPSSVGPGSGDAVSANVDYDPWLGAGVVAAKTGTTPPTTFDACTETDCKLIVDGDAIVTVACYCDNPGTGFSGDMCKYIDVHIEPTNGVTEVEIWLYYTDAEIRGFNELSLTLRWWDGSAWTECSDSGVNPADTNGYSGYIWAKIRGDTIPDLDDLTGTPFGGGGSPLVGGTVLPVDKVSILMPWIGLAVALALAGVFITRFARRKVRG